MKTFSNIYNYEIDDRASVELSYQMTIDAKAAMLKYLQNGRNESIENKARAFDFLSKILYTNMPDYEQSVMLDNLNEEEGTLVVWAVGYTTEDGDFLVTIQNKPFSRLFEIYSYQMYYDGTTLPIYKEDAPETEADMRSRLCEE